ncbi:hypothetical protein [Microbulbifer discodermiae]|uniref:hypothetical protein n=1 Tax=Microbulbifer sp. 2201CG32-9 TaxID=3232309 RepID=UPI00345C3C83
MELNFQYAHNDHDESETKPISDLQEALKAFDDFDWEGEVKKANEIQKCSPTLSLILERNKNMIWVSSWGEIHVEGFVSECYFLGVAPIFLGFGKKKGTVNLHTNDFSMNQAREALSLFIDGSYEKLRTLYEKA